VQCAHPLQLDVNWRDAVKRPRAANQHGDKQLDELGWLESHQYAHFDPEFLAYGPRDENERDFALAPTEESLSFALGDEISRI
jgi:hypothetical protein